MFIVFSFTFIGQEFKARKKLKSFYDYSGYDATEGNTRSHPEHDG